MAVSLLRRSIVIDEAVVPGAGEAGATVVFFVDRVLYEEAIERE
jgi:hypothetical protein